MKVTGFRLALALITALFFRSTGLSGQTDPAITVFIVRHAEKADQSSDPSLSPAGRDRARELTRVLKDARIGAVYVTQFKRTQETGQPVAEAIGQKPVIGEAGKTDLLVDSIRKLAPGSRVLVVSHSNVVPEMIKQLTGETITPLTESDYDGLYLVSLTGGQGSVVQLHYGAPSPTGPAGPMRQ
jgi:broad specificity phosphatase PhoE